MKRTCLTAIVLALMLALISSIGMAAREQKVTIWGRRAYIQEVFPAFEELMAKQGKQIKMEFTQVSSTDMTTKLMSAFAAGEAPDIVMLDDILGPYFGSIGAFADISKQSGALPCFNELSVGMMKLGQWQGVQYLLPLFSDNSALMYNRKLFKQAGLDPNKAPETWDDFVKCAKALTMDTNKDGRIDVYGTAFAIGEADMNMFTFLPFIWSNGGDILNDNGTKCLLDQPKAVEALQFWTDLIHKHKVTPPGTTSYGYTDMYNGFATEKIAMIIGGDWMIGSLAQDAPNIDYGVAYIPRPAGSKQSASFAGGDLIGITSTSKSKDVAWEFVKFALGEQVQVEVWAKHGAIPVVKGYYRNKYFAAEPKYAEFTKTLDVARAPFTTKYNEMYDPMLEAIQNATTLKMTPAQAFKRAAQTIDRILSQP